MRPHGICVALWAVVLAAASAGAAEHNPVPREPRAGAAAGTLGVILKLRPDPALTAVSKAGTGTERTATIAKRTGLALNLKREISESMLASSVELGGADSSVVLERLRADPAVEYAVPDRRRFVHATNPSDALFTNQWYLKATETSAVNAINAWDRERGTTSVVIAVLDTGVLYDHPDLGRGDRGGKLLPGYDFVSASANANDGDGRDADPSDPGDWVTATETAAAPFTSCDSGDSSWHGTRVAGMIGAITNNGSGIAGLDWNSYILPVRVLGKCGGTDSDILAGMRWAAGLPVPGVPANVTPARVLNMSLGSTSPCEASYSEVISELRERKILVVISAGNEGTAVSSPANCQGVAAVAAIRHAGSKVGFSNLGNEVTIGAPGGNCVNVNGGPCLFSLDTTSNAGTTAPTTHIFTDQSNSNLGTSFSAPIVSGIAGLMLSRNHNLSTEQLLARLREGARPYPTSINESPQPPICHVPASTQDFQLEQCLCTTATCGAGLADAAASLEAADRPIAAVALPNVVLAGQNVTLSAGGSSASCGRTVASFAWAVTAPTTNPPAISGANTATASLPAPTSGSVTIQVTVTDSEGRIDRAAVVLQPTSATSAAPSSAGVSACGTPVVSGVTPGGTSSSSSSSTSSSSSSSTSSGGGRGGGGSLELTTLFLLGLATLGRSRRVRA